MKFYNKLEKENAEFIEKWKKERTLTFKKFYVKKVISVFVFMALLYGLNCILDKNFNYKMSFCIYIAIAFLAPLVAWCLNELRFRLHKK